jgi:tetratricopeptide (TPR) repeat protein
MSVPPRKPSGPKPANRSSLSATAAARSRPVKEKKKPPIALFALIGAGVLGLAVTLAIVMTKKGDRPEMAGDAPRKPASAPAVPAGASARPEPAPAAPAKPEPKPEVKPEPPPPPKPKPPPDDPKEALKKRLEQKRVEALARVEEAKAEIAKEKAEAKAAADALRARLATRPLELKLKAGESIKGAVITEVGPHDAELQGGRRILWDGLEPASLRAAADAIFDPKKGKDQYDRGRFFIARRMWKEAKEAFDAAGQIGDGYESEVLTFINTLERLLSENGAFKGSARRLGPSGIRISYDFKDKAQLDEFSGGLAHEKESAILETKGRTAIYARGAVEEERAIAFLDEFSAELKVTSDVPVTFYLFASQNGVYTVELGPKGAVLSRQDKSGGKKEIAKADKVKFALNKAQEVRLVCKARTFKVSIDKQEALSASDPAASVDVPNLQGHFGFGIEKGKLKLDAPFVLQGSMNPADLQKRASDVETLLRNALNPELEEIRKRREEKIAEQALGREAVPPLSAEHIAFGLPDVAKLEALKRALRRHEYGENADFTVKSWADAMDVMVKKGDGLPALLYYRAGFRAERQDYDGALADARKAVELFPEFHEAHARLSDLLKDRYELEDAMKSANRAIELMPDSAEAYVNRAMVTYARDPRASAQFMEDLELAKKLDPTDATAATWMRILKYQARGPKDLGCRFDHETEHYKVTTDISPEAAKRYGEGLEAAFRHYQSTLGKPFPRGFGRKPRVAIFNTAENYYTYFELLSEQRGENTLGVFRPNLNELVLFETLDVEDTNHTLYHEAVHHFVQQLTPTHLPYWINEGIAEYLGAITVKGDRVTEKAKMLDRLPHIRMAVEVDSVYPFEKIMNESPREFYGGNVGLKYAQAWAMVHFFYEAAGGKHRPRIQKYLDLLLAGAPPRKAYEEAFSSGVADLEKEWKAFVKTLKM